jgi:hypothetical protein
MINFKRLSDQAKKAIDKRGGMESVKEDAEELRGIAKEKGSLSEKAKEAAGAIKDPGAKGPDPAAKQGKHPHKHPPGARPEADGPATRSK